MIPVRVRPGPPVIAAAVAATALISGAGVALAGSSSPSAPPTAKTAKTAGTAGTAVAAPSPSPSRCQIKLPGRGLPAGFSSAVPGPPGPFGFGVLGAIHGQFVAPRPGGGYQTIDTQRGTVTAVTTGSLTVKSSDGYTRTYQVTKSTTVDGKRAGIGSVKTGQTVSVLATVSGSAATATQIMDFAALLKPPAIPQEIPKILKPGSGPVLRPGPCANLSISQ